MDKHQLTSWIKERAKEIGFLDVGIAKADFLEQESSRLREWLDKGYHGTMSYMANHFDKRSDPRLLVDNAKSVICFSYNYYPEDKIETQNKIAKYAYGRDYHKVIKKKLKQLYRELNESYGPITGRYFVDSAPILERDWAKKAGLGWIGKNTLIIHPKEGSFFFLAEMILDVELIYDNPLSDYCGTCTRCIDACPTDAISQEGYSMDGSKCISYATIELKEDIPESFAGKMEDWIFGCDICQDVCPWNKFAKSHDESDFLPRDGLIELMDSFSGDTDKALFDKVFEGSAVKRTGYNGFVRNKKYIEGDRKDS